jgi:hypothetical protein
MMEGFGVHTFRLVNAEGVSRFVKFHWKPLKGVCSLVWEEATLISGKDPAGVGAAIAAQPLAQRFVHEAYRHGKPIAVGPDAEALLQAAGVPPAAAGIGIGQGSKLFSDLIKNLGQHRFPRRVSVLKPS